MQLRGARRRRGVDRGFVLSDHADWPGLQQAIRGSGAHRVMVTHGYVAVMVRWLAEQGIDAQALDTEFGAEEDSPVEATPTPAGDVNDGASPRSAGGPDDVAKLVASDPPPAGAG
jgi:putative mRNA 3-end processing factor